MKSTRKHRKHESLTQSVPQAAARGLLAAAIAAVATLCGGCFGGECEYRFVAPDSAGAAGSYAPVVVRLLRREILGVSSDVAEEPLTFKVGDQPLRAAFTDSDGYAAISLLLPETPGRYPLELYYQDVQGDKACSPAYAWALDPEATVVVVPLDVAAADADRLVALAGAGVVIAYADRGGATPMAEAHRRLLGAGLPDGPVLSWNLSAAGPTGSLAALAGSMRKMYCAPTGGRRFLEAAAAMDIELYTAW